MLRVVKTSDGFAVVDLNGDVKIERTGEDAWIRCVEFLAGHDTALKRLA
jgi:hypothetical protein